MILKLILIMMQLQSFLIQVLKLFEYTSCFFSWQSLFNVSDVGLNVLIKFIALFFSLLVKVLSLPMKSFTDYLPQGIEAGKRFLGHQKDNFTKYATCPSCHSIHNVDDCKVVLLNKSIISAVCHHIEFLNRPHKSRRKPCQTLLMKSIQTSTGTTTLYPRLLYCYKSVTNSERSTVKTWFY